MHDPIAAAVASVESGRNRLLWAPGHVPDDRLTWWPAPTAKNALQILSHVIASNAFFAAALQNGKVTQPPQQDAGEIASRDEAVQRLNSCTDDLIAASKDLSPERIGSAIPTPSGEISAAFILSIAGVHSFGHASQLEYLQTCWGDLDFPWDG